tara:strand:+ start:2046 stop:3047 length:1002 start_codon:yes stop_codon:yes gene_type:complete
MNNTVLVTGADGFIGSHLVEKLVSSGINVRAFCMYNSRGSWGWLDTLPTELKDNLDVVLGDIRDPLCVKNSMTGCSQVFHLAALIGIPYSYVAPSSYIDTNIHGTLNVVQSARDLGIERVIHTSTSEAYGSAQFVPITEAHPLVGQSPYAATKIAADQIALSYWRSFETPVTVLRPFNTYGPRQSSRAVIPTIISQIASGKKKLELGDLSPTRDFNFVEDTCSAFIAVSKTNKAIGKVINAASNFEVSIANTVKYISEIMNKDIEIALDKNRIRPKLSEVNRLFGDNSLLKEITDWQPMFEGIEGFKRGLKITADWFKNPDNIAFYRADRYSV